MNMQANSWVASSRQTQASLHLPQCLREKSHQFPVTPLTFQGTGKRYASAFALREMKAKKTFFIVHREQIAK